MKAITPRQMARLDDLMIKSGIELEMMMENAGINLAKLAKETLKNKTNKRIIILAGKGNNGGGGIAAARHLFNFGFSVTIILSDKKIKKVPSKQLKILKNMRVPIIHFNKNKIKKIGKLLKNSDFMVDSLLGYNAKGNPYGKTEELIILANNGKKPILSLDIPSGLDPDSGKTSNPCIKAKATLTLAVPKKGLMVKKAKKYVGKLFLADISVPQKIYGKFGFDRKVFSKESIIRVY